MVSWCAPTLLLLIGLISRLIAAPVGMRGPVAEELGPGTYRDGLITGRIISRPRHPRPYEVTFGLGVLAENYELAEGTEVGRGRTPARGSRFAGSNRHLQGGVSQSIRSFYCRGVYLPWRNISGLRRGDLVALRARVTQIIPEHPFTPAAYLLRHGYTGRCRVIHAARVAPQAPSFVERMRERLQSYVIATLGEGERSGMLLALTLGERDGISLQMERLFQQAGLSHILVLSGFQVSLIFALGMRLLSVLQQRVVGDLRLSSSGFPLPQWLMPHLFLPQLIALGGALLLVAISGFETSAARALLAVFLLAIREMRGLERSVPIWQRLNGVGVVGCLMVIIWPGCFFEPGVELTFAALIALTVGPAFVGASGLREFLLVTSLVSIVTSVVAGVWFGTLPLLGVPANIVVAPVFSYVGTLGGLLSIGLVAIGVDPDGLTLRLIAGILEFLQGVVAVGVTWVMASSALYCALLLGHLLLFAITVRLLLRQLRIVRTLLLGVSLQPESFVG